jgi:DNA-binding response OmpR family regulator
MKILLIEDSQRLLSAIESGLRKSGFAVDTAADGTEGYYMAQQKRYDAVILDLMLPGMDGLTILKNLREQGNDVHILILTARDTIEERVKGLGLGADDYLTKPFAFEELLARIQSLLRRKYNLKSPLIEIGTLSLNTATKTVTRNGQEIHLSPREYRLLEMLASSAGTLVSRTEIEESIYDERVEPMSNVVDSAVCILRKKINISGQPNLIHTRKGLGYIMQEIPA